MGGAYGSWTGSRSKLQHEGAFCPICRTRTCAHFRKLNAQISAMQKQKLKREVFGESPPNVFVGHYGYPQVMAGPLVAATEGVDTGLVDSPRKWYGRGYQEIIEFRSNLIRGKRLQNVKQASSREFEQLQETVLSVKGIDLEVTFKKEPTFGLQFSLVSQPMGPSADMEKMRIAGNPVIPKKIDSVIEENLKAKDAIGELLNHNYDLYYLQKLLSAGILGKNESKKMVPTRWAITAADTMIANEHISKLKDMKELQEIRIYSNEYMDNRFEILLLPGKWEFEQFEAWKKSSNWNHTGEEWQTTAEYEPFEGRSDYAETEAGGYYAGRLAVAEALATRLHKQARAVVFREIYDGYSLPLGVWLVRESARQAFGNPPTKCSTLDEAMQVLGMRLRNPFQNYATKSAVLQQRRLLDF